MKKNIIIIDDDTEILKSIKKILTHSNENYQIETFDKPKEALKYIVSNYKIINLIIADIAMQELSGIELLKKCEHISNIPVLFLTAYQDNETVRSAFELVPKTLTVNYIVKPFNTIIFLSSVSTLLKIQDYSLKLIHKDEKIETLVKSMDKSNKYLINRLNELMADKK